MSDVAMFHSGFQHEKTEQNNRETCVPVLMSEYSRMQASLVSAIARREGEARKILGRIKIANPEIPGFEPVSVQPRQSGAETKIANLVSRATTARQLCPKATAPMISALARALDREEIGTISEIDQLIAAMEEALATLEARILDMPPETMEDASQKLAFISSLMMDHHDFERDYFAFLIAECSEIVKVFGSGVWDD